MMTGEEVRTEVGLRSARGPVLLGVMLSSGLVAIDATILATAVPAIVADLGGLAEFPWLFSVYLLAQAVSVPLFAKFADLVGRKPVLLIGISVFVLGSLLCGVAWSMEALIMFRVIQGLGAGAVQPTAMAIIGDIYSIAERARVQGYVASVWAVSALAGPTLGGVFSDYVHWRWIFLVNLPLGACAAWILFTRFHEHVQRRERSIDYAGAALLAVGGTFLLLGLLEGGHGWAWNSLTSIGLFGSSLALVALFVVVERRAPEPLLPLWIFKRRTLVAANLVASMGGMLTVGLSPYVPLYAQRVLGANAVVAGLSVAVMSLGWPVAASLAGRFYLTIGFRRTLLMGSGFVTAGALVLVSVGESSSVVHLAAGCFVMGLGFGFAMTPSLVAAQASVTWQHRGVITGANALSRSVGGALGVAVFGAVINARVTGNVGAGLGHDLGRETMSAGLHVVFVSAFIVAASLLVSSLVMPRTVHEADER